MDRQPFNIDQVLCQLFTYQVELNPLNIIPELLFLISEYKQLYNIHQNISFNTLKRNSYQQELYDYFTNPNYQSCQNLSQRISESIFEYRTSGSLYLSKLLVILSNILSVNLVVLSNNKAKFYGASSQNSFLLFIYNVENRYFVIYPQNHIQDASIVLNLLNARVMSQNTNGYTQNHFVLTAEITKSNQSDSIYEIKPIFNYLSQSYRIRMQNYQGFSYDSTSKANEIYGLPISQGKNFESGKNNKKKKKNKKNKKKKNEKNLNEYDEGKKNDKDMKKSFSRECECEIF